MLALRSSDGLLSVLLQAESSDARDAAETGITRILGELNRPRNRGLLVKDGSAKDPDGYLWDRDAAAFRNPCLPRDSATTTGEDPDAPDVADDPDDPNDPDDPFHPANPSIGFRAQPAGSTDSPAYNMVLLNAAGAVVSEPDQAVKSYRLLSVKRQPLRTTDDDDDRPSLRLFDANGRGTVVLTVEGSAWRNGRVISSVQLQEELQLVPKCCGVSFGGAHGDSDYQPDDQGESVCVSDGWGVVAGMAQNGSGSMTINGVTTIVDASGNSVNPLYCVAASTQECSFNPTSTDFTLRLVSPVLPPVRTNPVRADSLVGSITRDAVPQDYLTAGSQRPFLSCTTAGVTPASLKQCPDGKVTINAAADDSGLPGHCKTGNYQVAPEASDALHCNLSELDYSQLTIEVVGTDSSTGGRALRLYFPVAPAGGGDVIRSTGGGTLRHEGEASRFALFGCADCAGQAVKLAGSAEGLHLFAWFPRGTVTVAGASEYQGVIWANRITSNGGVAWTVPSASVISALQLARFGLEGDLNPPLFDWVARSVRAFRWLGR